jgi:hypothetical protein
MLIRGERFQGRWLFDGDTMLDYELLPEPLLASAVK